MRGENQCLDKLDLTEAIGQDDQSEISRIISEAPLETPPGEMPLSPGLACDVRQSPERDGWLSPLEPVLSSDTSHSFY